ncbi:hypothetical protein [Bradyrhizobium sp. USDA 4353]
MTRFSPAAQSSRHAAGWGISMSNKRHFASAAIALLLLSPVINAASAAGLECPDIPAASALKSSFAGMAAASTSELANEIDALIVRMQNANPNASYSDMTDDILAGYCASVATLSAPLATKWKLLRQFDRLLQAKLAANMLPSGSEILATVPLPPAVYDSLRAQAASAGLTTTTLMTAILSKAAGR